jgi:hypothetical protein
VYLAEAAAFQADFDAAIAATVTRNATTGAIVFVPPVAVAGFAPFGSMIESTIAEYSNFRYFSELLGADVLTADASAALQDFRESTFGTVSGITRWSDHLDDMPSSYYLAASLRDDRVERFQLLLYGHSANYAGRGTGTATEQLPIVADANGLFRDYLWGYLEGGIDECVPSIMLPALGTRWQVVQERWDTDTVWLAKGAPRRWFDPAGPGFAVARAWTRFGWVALAVANTGGGGAGEGQASTAVVTLTLPPVLLPGTTATPQFALRLLSSDASDALDAGSVAVAGAGAVLASVDAVAALIYVNVTGSGGSGGSSLTFTVTASFVPSAA